MSAADYSPQVALWPWPVSPSCNTPSSSQLLSGSPSCVAPEAAGVARSERGCARLQVEPVRAVGARSGTCAAYSPWTGGRPARAMAISSSGYS